MGQEWQAPVVEIVQARPMEESHVLKQTLGEHLRADIDPSAHHSARGRVDLEGEGVEHDLREVVIVAIAIYQLLQIVEYFELTKQLIDAFI